MDILNLPFDQTGVQSRSLVNRELFYSVLTNYSE